MSKIFLFVLLAIVPTIASAHSGEIYTYGYHSLVVETLTAVSGIVASNNDVLFQMAMALSIFIFGIKNFLNPNGKAGLIGMEVAKFLIVVGLIQQLFLTAPDDNNHAFAVVDRISSQTSEVRQVPKGLGEILVLFTNLEDAIMQKMELYFSMPQSLSYRQAGLGFSMLAQIDTMGKAIINPHLQKNFEVYIKDCKVDGDWADGSQMADEILNAKDEDIISKLVPVNYGNLLTIIYSSASPTGDVASCETSWNNINSGLISDTQNALQAEAKAKGMTLEMYKDKLVEGKSSMLKTAAEDAQEQFKSAMARNATLDSLHTIAAASGMSEAQLTKNKSIAELNMTNSAIMSSYMAAGNMPLLKAVCVAFVISLTWLLAILTIATMNMSYLKFIITMNVWLLLWGPLFQVLNYAIDVMVADALVQYGGEISAANHVGIYNVLSTKLATLSNLVWAIPALAFAIAKGSDNAMVSFMSGMSAPLQQAATASTGAEMHGLNAGFTAVNLKNGATTQVGGGQTQSTAKHKDGFIGTTSDTGTQNILDTQTNSTITGAGSAITSIDAKGIASNKLASLESSLVQADAKKQNMVNELANTGTSSVANSKIHSSSDSFTTSDGKTVSRSDSRIKTLEKVNESAEATASKQTRKEDYVQALEKDISTKKSAGINVDTEKSILGKIASLGVGASLKSNVDGSVSLKDGEKTSYTFSSDSDFSKQFAMRKKDAVATQLKNDTTLAAQYAEASSILNGVSTQEVSQSGKSIKEAFSQSHELSNLVMDAQKLSNSVSKNETANWFNKFFEKNEGWNNASLEEKMEFAGNKIRGWIKDEDGLKEMMTFAETNGNFTRGALKSENALQNGANNDLKNLDVAQVVAKKETPDFSYDKQQVHNQAFNEASHSMSKHDWEQALKGNNTIQKSLGVSLDKGGKLDAQEYAKLQGYDIEHSKNGGYSVLNAGGNSVAEFLNSGRFANVYGSHVAAEEQKIISNLRDEHEQKLANAPVEASVSHTPANFVAGFSNMNEQTLAHYENNLRSDFNHDASVVRNTGKGGNSGGAEEVATAIVGGKKSAFETSKVIYDGQERIADHHEKSIAKTMVNYADKADTYVTNVVAPSHAVDNSGQNRKDVKRFKEYSY